MLKHHGAASTLLSVLHNPTVLHMGQETLINEIRTAPGAGGGGPGVRHSSSSSLMQRLLPSSRMAFLHFVFLLFLLIRNGERMLGEECGEEELGNFSRTE